MKDMVAEPFLRLCSTYYSGSVIQLAVEESPMSLLETDVPVQNVITTDPAKAKALENTARAKILDMLADEEMIIEEITDELARRGEEKAKTTVRHHVNVLKDAGMVELSRLEDAGGGTQKFYQSNTRVFSYDLPETAEETLSKAELSFREELAAVIADVYSEHEDEITAAATEMRPCDYCETQHYEEFILRELMNRALTDLSEEDELDDLLK
jgi:DNA-binding transcriptional ArsR family regulator